MVPGNELLGKRRNGRRTLFLEVVIALETAAKAIEGLASLADPESDAINCFPQSSHLLLLLLPTEINMGSQKLEGTNHRLLNQNLIFQRTTSVVARHSAAPVAGFCFISTVRYPTVRKKDSQQITTCPFYISPCKLQWYVCISGYGK